MKKLIVMASLLLGAMFTANAQDGGSESAIELRGGVYLGSYKSETPAMNIFGLNVPAQSTTTSGTGFYAGAGYNLSVSDKFKVVPGLDIVIISFGGSSLNQLQIPITAKYLVSEKIGIIAGPNVGYVLNSNLAKLNLSIDAGATYSITDEISASAKYQYGISNLIKDAPSGFSAKLSGIAIGVAYKL